MNRAANFYSKQDAWTGVYSGPVEAWHRARAATVKRLAGNGRRLLELGAGGGQTAAALADEGYQVTAVELVPALAAHAQQLAGQRPALTILEGDFYTIDLDGQFDTLCYWDGFGVGRDADQRRLLQRMAGWLRPGGCALIEIYTPWYWARAAGRSQQIGRAQRRYAFDAEGCRMIDSWWPKDDEAAAVSQSLRCYSPADLRLLLQDTGLALAQVEPGGAVDFEQGLYLEQVPLEQAMQYLARLIHG